MDQPNDGWRQILALMCPKLAKKKRMLMTLPDCIRHLHALAEALHNETVQTI